MKKSVQKAIAFTLILSLCLLTAYSVNIYAAVENATLLTKKVTLSVDSKKMISIENKSRIKSYTFLSKNMKIVTVSKKGEITAKAEGNTSITVSETYKKKTKKLGTVNVKVISNTKPAVTSTPQTTMNVQILKDSTGSDVVKDNGNGTSSVKIAGNYSLILIPIGKNETYDLSSFSKMVIDYKSTTLFRVSLFSSKGVNLKTPTSGTAEWSQWSYLGDKGYDGQTTIDISSIDREKVAYICITGGTPETLTLRGIQFVGDSQLKLNAQYIKQSVESGNPVATVVDNGDNTSTVKFLNKSAAVMFPIGDIDSYNLSQYTSMVMDFACSEEFRVSLYNSLGVNIHPGTDESKQWWYVGKGGYHGEYTFDLSNFSAKDLSDTAYVVVQCNSEAMKPITIKGIYFNGDARKNKVVVNATAVKLEVDASSILRKVTHCASGSLYGVTETKPVDIETLVEPLHPNVFTNPARAGSGYQQPIGGALSVADRLKGTTGQVMIRLADLYPGWPYQFPGMTQWLNDVTNVINEKIASGNNNFYGYEIWNEPAYTWQNKNGSFNDMWLQTYKLIKSKDPKAKIIGPSEGYYDRSTMSKFLSFCKVNSCLPDVVCWHELTYIGGTAKHFKDYRSLEKELGISEIPISINEYCDGDKPKEGCPGTSACYIAKFERYKIDSACISWWFTDAPGRLGSLLASNTEKGAGWWFYKWYGDMTGNMVSVTPPNEDSKSVDGFACADESKGYISCLLGGDSDGLINVKFNNLPSWIGSKPTVKIEAIDWISRTTVSTGPVTVSTSSYEVKNGSITVSLSGCNDTSGYRIYISK